MRSHVAWIHVAPIKALAIQELERVELGPLGVEYDRRFCIVDEAGRMLNAKRVPAFVTVRPLFDDASRRLTLRMPDGEGVGGAVELGAQMRVSIYGRHVPARAVAGPFAEALSSLARRPVRLVRFDDPGEGVDRTGAAGAATLLSHAALGAIADAAGVPGPIDARRFRMLFGIAGIEAHEEDGWVGRRVRIGTAVVVPVGNVGRCAVTSLDPDRGVSDLDTLAALGRYRGALQTTEPLAFGVSARVERSGAVALGDDVAA